MKPVSHELHSNRALEGQKLLVSTPFVLNALGFFSQPYKGAPALGRAACELEAAGTRWSARSLQPLARPAARARVTFTSICAAQGILVSPERWRRVRAGPARQAAAGLPSIAVTRVEAHPLLQGSDPCAVSRPRFRAILWFPCVPSSLPAWFPSAAPSLDCHRLRSRHTCALTARKASQLLKNLHEPGDDFL